MDERTKADTFFCSIASSFAGFVSESLSEPHPTNDIPKRQAKAMFFNFMDDVIIIIPKLSTTKNTRYYYIFDFE